MKFDQPATAPNPIDRQKVIGHATDRVEGPLKTTGTAPYAYERHDVVANQAYGFVLGAAIAKGWISSIDLGRARTAPGVLAIVTADNAGPLGKGEWNIAKLLAGPEVQHYHQAVAVVVAETFEQARTAAGLVQVRYVKDKGAFDLAAARAEKSDGGLPQAQKDDPHFGDFEGAYASAAVKLDATYTTPGQAHAMMEPHATIAAWDGDRLTLWTSNQMIDWGRTDVAETLQMPKESIRLSSPYIGGGFGGKLFVRADAVLAALGARAAGRPVKVALTRPQMFNNTTHRGATIQRICIGADKDGHITALAHEGWSGNLEHGKPENVVLSSRPLYAGANRLAATRLATLDLPEANAMRAPGDAPGSMAVEVAMDEMAEKLGLDPIEFRVLNDTQVNPETPDHAFSQRHLVECLRQGAERFGWGDRKPAPGRVRDGRWLVGMGVGAAYRASPLMKSGARVRLDGRGMVTVETDMTDIGTGSYTIIAQTAAEMMGLPLERVVVRLGDSTFPVSAGSGGQFGAISSTAGVYAACVKLREAVAAKLGFNVAEVDFADGRVRTEGHTRPLADAARDGELVGEDTMEYGDFRKQLQQASFGAHFVEVGVDADTAEIRLRRMLAVCSCGRILNPKAARSQMIGAMTMGAGAALMEELVVDTRHGFFVNHDLAGYEVPVHADIPHQEVVFLEEVDPTMSPMKGRGVGELGICGVAAAIANAVHNATGVRVRDYPITLDKLIGRMPAV
ncbi:MAG: xanthine dehydrogenase family protein molybdopterin-binding subunit [Azospirillaceae bacterium]|nr:xanthine dehydrogenase family protein molybdopterin-binding subunit [Azospirillaceae bacterium]